MFTKNFCALTSCRDLVFKTYQLIGMKIIFASQANVNLSNAQKRLLIYNLKFQVSNCLLELIKNHKK